MVRFEEMLHLLGPDLTRGVRAALGLIDAATLPTQRKRFSELSVDTRQRLLVRWNESASKQLRWALRMILTPLKAAHFDDDSMFEHVGCRRKVDTPTTAETERWMQGVINGWEVEGDLELECEVVVIGTGAGGAAVAYELARRGRAVLMVEAGDYHKRTEFSGRPTLAYSKMYVGKGGTVALGNVAAPVWAGRTVGGTTTINSGTCYRAPDRTLSRWGQSLRAVDAQPQRSGPLLRAGRKHAAGGAGRSPLFGRLGASDRPGRGSSGLEARAPVAQRAGL